MLEHMCTLVLCMMGVCCCLQILQSGCSSSYRIWRRESSS